MHARFESLLWARSDDWPLRATSSATVRLADAEFRAQIDVNGHERPRVLWSGGTARVLLGSHLSENERYNRVIRKTPALRIQMCPALQTCSHVADLPLLLSLRAGVRILGRANYQKSAYLEPIPNRIACNPTNGIALGITENDAKLAMVSRLSELVREFDQFLPDVVGFTFRHIVVNAVFHVGETIRFFREVDNCCGQEVTFLPTSRPCQQRLA